MPDKRIVTVRIKLFDKMIRELKDVRYVPQLQKNLIPIGALKVQGLREILEEGVLTILSASLVVLKGIRHNNLYYLKSGVVIKNLAVSEHSKDDSTGYGRWGSNKLVCTPLKYLQIKDY